MLLSYIKLGRHKVSLNLAEDPRGRSTWHFSWSFHFAGAFLVEDTCTCPVDVAVGVSVEYPDNKLAAVLQHPI